MSFSLPRLLSKLQSIITIDTANSNLIVANSIVFSDGTKQTTAGVAVDAYARTTANGANELASGAYAQANTATGIAQAAFNSANNVAPQVQPAFDKANTAAANTVYLTGVDATQNTNITSVNQYAASAYNKANNALPLTGGTITGSLSVSQDLSISGNLTVLGNSTTLTTSTLDVGDSLIYLANNNLSSDIVDIGIIGHYNDGANAHAGLVRDPSLKEWIFFKGYTPDVQSNNLINIAHPSFAYANAYVDTLKASRGLFVNSSQVIAANGVWIGANTNLIGPQGPAGANGASGSTPTVRFTTYQFVSTNNQTVFTGVDSIGQTLSYNVNAILVTLNGATLKQTEDYIANNGTSITLTSGTDANDNLGIVSFEAFNVTPNQNTITTYYYTANNNQTSFGGADIFGQTLSYEKNNLLVYLNGLRLFNGSDYTAANGTYITLMAGPAANDEVVITAFSSFTSSGGYTQAQADSLFALKSGDTFTGNVSITSNGYLQMPIGTTAQRPAATSAGLIRFNTTLGTLESANGTAWANVGSGSASSGGGGVSWQAVQNTNFIAVTGSAYFVNTFSSNVTVTLPASPTIGQEIRFVDYGGYMSSNALIIFPNGNKILGNTANATLTTNTASISIVYSDANKGWIPYSGFTSSPIGNYFVQALILAGGGGSYSAISGGGGAGGLIYASATPVIPGTSYTINVGGGGAVATNGTNSSGLGQTATGGGAGGPGYSGNGFAGGSGGGGSRYAGAGGAGTSGQGNPGGAGTATGGSDNQGTGGGGGGAGAVGGGASGYTAGNGGNGSAYSISGSSVTYAGGGGGGAYNGTGGTGGSGGGGPGTGVGTSAGTAGTNNLGGGAGAPGYTAGAQPGATGGSGVVIISYLGGQRGFGGSVTQSGGYTIHTFTSSGTFIA